MMSYPDARYHGDGGEVSAVYRPASQAPDLLIGEAVRASYLATGALTAGQFGLYRWDMGPKAGGPAAHFHRTITESFFVLSGMVRLYDGERWVDASAGDFLYVPQGGIHAFRNDSDGPASILLLFTPGAPREGYFEALRDVATRQRQFAPDEWQAFLREHDNHMV
jgi:mannose-6-phosphate isomerase-like protein (cupin superfamily)